MSVKSIRSFGIYSITYQYNSTWEKKYSHLFFNSSGGQNRLQNECSLTVIGRKIRQTQIKFHLKYDRRWIYLGYRS